MGFAFTFANADGGRLQWRMEFVADKIYNLVFNRMKIKEQHY
jgi:hypothetical protein